MCVWRENLWLLLTMVHRRGSCSVIYHHLQKPQLCELLQHFWGQLDPPSCQTHTQKHPMVLPLVNSANTSTNHSVKNLLWLSVPILDIWHVSSSNVMWRRKNWVPIKCLQFASEAEIKKKKNKLKINHLTQKYKQCKWIVHKFTILAAADCRKFKCKKKRKKS